MAAISIQDGSALIRRFAADAVRLENRNRLIVTLGAIVAAFAMTRTLFAPGTLGYVDDWNIPSTAQGLWIWGLAHFSPWQAVEFGMPLAYPTDIYLQFALGLFGLAGIAPHVAVATFLSAALAAGFIGTATLAQELWQASTARQIVSASLYVTAPVLFDALVPGYLTFAFSYCLFPWIAVALVHAVRGQRKSWIDYALLWGLRLTQVQFIVFDAAVCIALLAGLKTRARTWLWAAGFAAAGGAGLYLFIIANTLGVATIVQKTTALSEHSWTSLSSPGVINALAQIPSVYPFFDQSLHDWAFLYRLIAVAWTLSAIVLGFSSPSRIARSFASLLVVTLVFLHGPQFPIAEPMRWLLELPAMALLRNINYVFVPMTFAASLLISAPLLQPRYERSRTWCIVLLAGLWVIPFFENTYSPWLKPVPEPNTTNAIVGEDDRTLVLPHLQVTDPRQASTGGVNPNAVGTITPIFVRNTAAGPLEAAILDDLTDWTPQPRMIEAALATGRINHVAVQTALDSTFPEFVNSYRDDWLTAAFQTAGITDKLSHDGDLIDSVDGTTQTFTGNAHFSDVQTARSAIAVSGGLEDEIDARALGVSSLFVPATEVPAGATWIGGLVHDVTMPPLLPSPEDVRARAYLLAGMQTDHKTADFHEDWADPLASVNWWIDSRLLTVAHAAITDKPGEALAIDVPPGRRHIFVQYYASRMGGALAIAGPIAHTTIDTYDLSLGEFRWLDLGTESAGRPLVFTSLNGFNGIGAVMMFDDSQMRADKARFAAFAAHGQVGIQPSVTFGESLPLLVSDPRWRPSVLLSRPSQALAADVQARIRRSARGCEVEIGNALLSDFSVALDGRPQRAGTGRFFPLTAFDCKASAVVLHGVPLTARAQTIRDLGPSVQIVTEFGHTDAANVVDRTIAVPFLPLAIAPLGSGQHHLTISYPPLFPAPGESWSALEDAQRNNPPYNNDANVRVSQRSDRTDIELQTTYHTVDVHVPLRAPLPNEQLILTGSYAASKGSAVRIMLYDGVHDKEMLAQTYAGDGNRFNFHIDLSSVQRSVNDLLYVYLDPQGTGKAGASILLSPAVPKVSANVVLARPGFRVDDEQQLNPENDHFLRFSAANAARIVQYDQTFDKGWQVPGAAQHLASAAGFNLWVMNSPSSRVTIRYRTGLAYALGLVASALVVIALLALRAFVERGIRRGPGTLA